MALIISRRSFYCPNFATAPKMNPNEPNQKMIDVWQAIYDNDLGTRDLEFPQYVEELNSYAEHLARKDVESGEDEIVRLWKLYRQDPSADRDGFTWYLSDYRETKEWGGLTADQEKEYWYRWCTEDEGEARQNLTFPRYVGQRYRFGRLPVSL